MMCPGLYNVYAIQIPEDKGRKYRVLAGDTMCLKTSAKSRREKFGVPKVVE
jgi:hypothetical protein